MRWVAGLNYGGSGVGLVAGPPGAGDKFLASRSPRSATSSIPAPLDSRPPQADTGYASCGNDEREIGLTNAGTLGTAKYPFRTNYPSRLASAHQGMTTWALGWRAFFKVARE